MLAEASLIHEVDKLMLLRAQTVRPSLHLAEEPVTSGRIIGKQVWRPRPVLQDVLHYLGWRYAAERLEFPCVTCGLVLLEQAEIAACLMDNNRNQALEKVIAAARGVAPLIFNDPLVVLVK